MTTTAQEVACPKCGSPCWDNTLTKRNPKAPNFKCKDRSCDGAIWPPKAGEQAPARTNGSGGATPALAAATAKQGYTAGPHIPAIDGEHPEMRHEKLDAQFAVYDLCLAHAHSAAVKRFGADVTDTAVASMAATLYIQATRSGV